MIGSHDDDSIRRVDDTVEHIQEALHMIRQHKTSPWNNQQPNTVKESRKWVVRHDSGTAVYVYIYGAGDKKTIQN